MTERQPVLVVIGVSRSGKSTMAGLLAGRLGRDPQEGDDLHRELQARGLAQRSRAAGGCALISERRTRHNGRRCSIVTWCCSVSRWAINERWQASGSRSTQNSAAVPLLVSADTIAVRSARSRISVV
jgi:Fe-S cluster assembly ATPase SufC